MAEVIHRYVGRGDKLPKPTPEEKRRAAAVHKADAELAKERTESIRIKRMQNQLVLARARGELIPKEMAQSQASFLILALRAQILAIPQSYSRKLLGIADYETMSAELRKMAHAVLSEIENFPERVTDPNWLQTLESDGK